MTEEEIIKVLMGQGITGIILGAIYFYYIKYDRPDRITREGERDRLHSQRISELVELLRDREQEATKREQMIREEHGRNWDEHRAEVRDQREQDRAMFREMVSSMSGCLKDIGERTSQNFGGLLALGERLGLHSSDIEKRTQEITGREIKGKRPDRSDG